MATEISMEDWLHSLELAGHTVSFDVVVEDVFANSVVRLRPVIRAGELVLWQGPAEMVAVQSALSWGGFRFRDGNLTMSWYEEA